MNKSQKSLIIGHYYGPNVPQSSYMEALVPSVIVFGDRACEEMIKVNKSAYGLGPSARTGAYIRRESRYQVCAISMWRQQRGSRLQARK